MRKGRVTRLRSLTPAQEQQLAGLRSVAELLDSAFLVPGTSYRVGLDPIIGLIPGIGDLISPLFAIGMLLQARQLGVPKIIQARMIGNVAIDALVGAVPVAGDLFDFAWKANERNLALLELHAREERSGSAGDYAFVTLMILIVMGLAAIPLLLLGWLLSALGARWV
ncbi:MAG: DUF4112 domain-containing protein [Geminicoccales bacterium]